MNKKNITVFPVWTTASSEETILINWIFFLNTNKNRGNRENSDSIICNNYAREKEVT